MHLATRPSDRNRTSSRMSRAALIVCAVLVFAFSWLFRFNDPGGSFAGLTDDHFFYVVRGWQILFGDLPVRDFVDHGAPLYFYVAALVQEWFGRGTLSEVTFSVTVLSAAAAATFLLAARASGSIVAALAATAVHVLLQPRFYNYPKILVYVVAIPLFWRFADRPGAANRFWIALATAVAFLFRHDHGPFVAVAFAALLAALPDLRPRERLRHAVMYAALVLALLAPYLVFIQLNGGLGTYFRDASAWAARDRDRAPVVWPDLFEESGGEAASGASSPGRAVVTVRDNFAAWMFYLEVALPLCAFAVLALSPDAFRPGWRRAFPKLVTVATLGVVLNAGFLRSPLGARLADPSVPHAILLAWLAVAAIRACASRGSLHAGVQPWAGPVRAFLVTVILSMGFVLGAGLSNDLYDRLDAAALVEGPRNAIERVRRIRSQLQRDWQLETWRDRPDRPDLITLALYLEACTKPGDRIFVQPYIPQVLALSRRAFAGGHADLRPGFFNSPEAQRITVERLQQQSVPVVLLETGDSYQNFRRSFPIVTRYLDERFEAAGTHVFDDRFALQLLLPKGAAPSRRFNLIDWPCA
jgi:hypothetical protein